MTTQSSTHQMQLDSLRTDPLLPLETVFGPLTLKVRDADAALSIWRDVVGLEVIGDVEGVLRLGVNGRVMIILETGVSKPVKQGSLGLYHVAIHVPERADLARFVVRAVQAGVRIAPTDHLVTEAVYAWDADGNGIEITFETPERGTLADPASGYFGVANDGQPHSGREPLDLDNLMLEIADDSEPGNSRMPVGTRLGHVHVHVLDLDDAMRFYRDVIGYAGQFIMREWGLGDVGLGYMPHALAFNIWAGPGATQGGEDAAGLRYFTIIVPDTNTLDQIVSRLTSAGHEVRTLDNGIETSDPSGNRMQIVVA